MKEDNIGKKCTLRALRLVQGEPFTPDAYFWFFIVGEKRGWYFVKPILLHRDLQGTPMGAIPLSQSVFKVKPSEIIIED